MFHKLLDMCVGVEKGKITLGLQSEVEDNVKYTVLVREKGEFDSSL